MKTGIGMESIYSKEKNEFNNKVLAIFFSVFLSAICLALCFGLLVETIKDDAMMFSLKIGYLFLCASYSIPIIALTDYSISKLLELEVLIFKPQFLFFKKMFLSITGIIFLVSIFLCGIQIHQINQDIHHTKEIKIDFLILMFFLSYGCLSSLILVLHNKKFIVNIYNTQKSGHI